MLRYLFDEQIQTLIILVVLSIPLFLYISVYSLIYYARSVNMTDEEIATKIESFLFPLNAIFRYLFNQTKAAKSRWVALFMRFALSLLPTALIFVSLIPPREAFDLLLSSIFSLELIAAWLFGINISK